MASSNKSCGTTAKCYGEVQDRTPDMLIFVPWRSNGSASPQELVDTEDKKLRPAEIPAAGCNNEFALANPIRKNLAESVVPGLVGQPLGSWRWPGIGRKEATPNAVCILTARGFKPCEQAGPRFPAHVQASRPLGVDGRLQRPQLLEPSGAFVRGKALVEAQAAARAARASLISLVSGLPS